MNRIFDTLLIALAVACVIFALTGCEKEEKNCTTCTVTGTTQAPGQPLITSIESITEYCNGEWTSLDTGLINWKNTSTDGGQTWTKYKQYRECKPSQ